MTILIMECAVEGPSEYEYIDLPVEPELTADDIFRPRESVALLMDREMSIAALLVEALRLMRVRSDMWTVAVNAVRDKDHEIENLRRQNGALRSELREALAKNRATA